MAFVFQMTISADGELEDTISDNCIITLFRRLNCAKCKAGKFSCVSPKSKRKVPSPTYRTIKEIDNDFSSFKEHPPSSLPQPQKHEDGYRFDKEYPFAGPLITGYGAPQNRHEYPPTPTPRHQISIVNRVPSCKPETSVSTLRQQFERKDEFGSGPTRVATVPSGDYSSPSQDRYGKDLAQASGIGQVGAQSARNGISANEQRSQRLPSDKLKDGEKIYESRQHYKSIIGDAPLYQMYNEASKRTESKRFRQRLRESIRLTKKGPKTTRDAFPVCSGVADIEKIIGEISSEEDSDIDKQVSPTPSSTQSNQDSGFVVNAVTESRRDRVLVTPTAKGGEMRSVASELAGTGPGRMRWCEMPEVVSRNLAAGLTPSERMLQEARFEILTSEASYYKSLTVLVDLFYKSPVFNPSSPNAILTSFDKHQLFSNILEIHVTSENLLHALEMNFRKDPMMHNICEILYEHSENKLSCYISYLKNQMYQVNTLKMLLSKPAFSETVRSIQRFPACNCLDLNSFLVLPMQRAMRLRLLVEAVLHHTSTASSAYRSGLVALASLEKLIHECNSQKGHMERKERLVTLSSQLEFSSTTRAIGMSNRELVKEGKLRCLPNSKETASGFRRKFSDAIKNKPTLVTLFLFTDILLITRQKGEKYIVDEVCPTDKFSVTVQFTPADAVINRTKLQTKANVEDPFYVVPQINIPRDVARSRQYERPPVQVNRASSLSKSLRRRDRSSSRSSTSGLQDTTAKMFSFILTFPHPEGGLVDYHLTTDTLEARERWIDALNPGYYSPPPEVSYDTWDCPQMIVISSHGATEYDELDVKEGDLMNVIVELSDGWLKGTLPDGRSGWLPKNVCAQVENPQARRQNMKNFLLSEEAHRAYEMRKKIDRQQNFARMQDIRSNRT